MSTLFVNLYAGPGAGKSTGAAYIFSKLKILGVNAELVTEYAKDLVWEANGMHPRLGHQEFVFARQKHRCDILEGKVDVVVTDSPLSLPLFYAKDASDEFKAYVWSCVRKQVRRNYLLERIKPYNPKGRLQNWKEAAVVDVQIRNFLWDNDEAANSICGDDRGYDLIVADIVGKLPNHRRTLSFRPHGYTPFPYFIVPEHKEGGDA